MRHASVAALTLRDLPVETLIAVAAGSGFQGVSLPAGNTLMPPEMRDPTRPYCLIENAALRRQTRRQAADQGISLDLMEGFVLSPSFSREACVRGMDAADDLEIPRINTVNFD